MSHTFSDNLKKYRHEKGLGVNELGRRVGVSGAYISALEMGKKQNPSLEIIEKIATALDIPSSFLTSNNCEHKDIYSLFNGLINDDQLIKESEKFRISTQFLNLLGYKIEFQQTDDEGNGIILINNVEYSLSQFDILLNILKTSVENSNNLLSK